MGNAPRRPFCTPPEPWAGSSSPACKAMCPSCSRPPSGASALRRLQLRDGPDQVEIGDADDFDPWPTLRGETVRVIRYRPHPPDGEVVEAYWLTNFPSRHLRRRCFYARAKSRGPIENQGFHDAQNRYGLEPICPHPAQSRLVVWLLTCLARTRERLYRLRYLRRGTHAARTALDLLRLLLLSLSAPGFADSR